jgi:cobalt/nickel transport system permease protein
LDWLFKEDDYSPIKDKDAFINKSILIFVNALSKIQRSNIKGQGFIYEINPLLKVLSVFLLLVLISISRSMFFLFTALALVLEGYIFIRRADSKKVLSLSLLAALFSLVILLPSMFWGNMRNSLIIILKVFMTVSTVNILSFSTGWHDVTKSLRALFIPDIFIFILDTSIRYIYLLGDICLNMMQALKSRTIGRNKNKYNTMAGIIGNLFTKSVEMGSEMYYAMECRGFTGEYAKAENRRFKARDIYYLIVILIMVSLFVYTGGLR